MNWFLIDFGWILKVFCVQKSIKTHIFFFSKFSFFLIDFDRKMPPKLSFKAIQEHVFAWDWFYVWYRRNSIFHSKSLILAFNRCCQNCVKRFDVRYRFRIDFWTISEASDPWKWWFRIDENLLFIKSLFRKSDAKMITFWSKKYPEINQKSMYLCLPMLSSQTQNS